MGRGGYPPEFPTSRARPARGRSAGDGSGPRPGISSQTIDLWRHQEQIDRGLVAGLTSTERTELAAARRRIRELEAELEIHRRASELLVDRSDPKGGSRRSP